jgi:hypothetical protein
MDSETNWQLGYQKEIIHAVTARNRGNEGMARVCARRAAGIILGEYLSRCGLANFGTSVIDRTAIFLSLPNVDQRCKEIASHFLQKVDSDHHLPQDADLISEVEWLVKTLLLENN